MRTLSANAYAKINLTLNITGRREDGYHTLESVMHTVSLCDRVLLRQSRSGCITLGCNLPYLPRDGRNLAVRAAEGFFAAAGFRNPGLEIHIKKVIPVGAGMAGGSTDAAAVLRLLDRMYRHPLSRNRMDELALSLGADVPFCMRRGAALAAGIGEELSPAPPLPDCHLVICKPPVPVSTKRAYGLLDECAALEHPPAAAMLSALEKANLRSVCAALGNSFQTPIEEDKPVIGDIRRVLLAQGAMGALMSGSGSAVFGIFEELKPAQNAAAALRTRFRDVFLVKPVSV